MTLLEILVLALVIIDLAGFVSNRLRIAELRRAESGTAANQAYPVVLVGVHKDIMEPVVAAAYAANIVTPNPTPTQETPKP